jgi:hypothetical protein
MPTLAVGMWGPGRARDMPTASVGMAPAPTQSVEDRGFLRRAREPGE